jgi:hypothetical protein
MVPEGHRSIDLQKGFERSRQHTLQNLRSLIPMQGQS